MISYGKHDINQNDIHEVIKCLQSDFLTQGNRINIFENKISTYCNCKFAAGVNSGTSALVIGCMAIGLVKNDILWTSPISFVSSANCGLFLGAKIDFVDINEFTFNIDTEKLELKLKKAKKQQKLPKAIVVVHMAGLSCDMKEIYKLSKKYKFKIIEDASHGLGGSYYNHKIGSCKFSDITVLSFHPVKTITTAEGGMCLTNNFTYYKKILKLRNNGVQKNLENKPRWFYSVDSLGLNFRMNDIQASLGISQAGRIDSFIKKRKIIANRYNKILQDLPIKLPNNFSNYSSSWHLYIVRLKEKKHINNKKKIFDYLYSNKIITQVHYIPIHTHNLYKKFGFKKNDFPEAINYYDEAISLPIYPKLKYQEQLKVCKVLKKCLKII